MRSRPACMQAASSLHAFATQRSSSTASTSAPERGGSNNKQREAFLATYPQLRNELLNDPLLGVQPEYARRWFAEMMDYNVPGGKLNRGLAVIESLAAVQPPGLRLSEADAHAARVVGFCIEWLQAFFLVADDIMDGSEMRRGRPAWHRLPGVGLSACNDYILLSSSVYRLLKKHLSGHPAYVQILELFHDVTHQTAYGQLLDLKTATPGGRVDLERYTLENYATIVRYKTAYYSFYMPVAAGMLLGGVRGRGAYDTAEKILLEMGEYFQVQDDFLDAFGDPATTGKVGTDIQDGKCSWLVCTALAGATGAQRAAIEANYGRADAACVATVKRVFEESGVEAKFKEYEAESYRRLSAAIKAQTALPQQVFMSLLRKIYRRTK
ncbi:hypothetical protein FOA52_012860 [Chlamydomonas sp. UWO 241]|nr:hypothetical protein FOA52_012860 [Chlamydomonas sp. UWO 241]